MILKFRSVWNSPMNWFLKIWLKSSISSFGSSLFNDKVWLLSGTEKSVFLRRAVSKVFRSSVWTSGNLFLLRLVGEANSLSSRTDGRLPNLWLDFSIDEISDVPFFWKSGFKTFSGSFDDIIKPFTSSMFRIKAHSFRWLNNVDSFCNARQQRRFAR